MRLRWLWAPVVLGIAVLLLSQVNADAYRPAISAAIESGLGRRVEIRGPLRLNPLRFGFLLEQVVIHEDARFGIEPLAYVSSLDATLRWTALVRGRLEFSGLRLVEPSLNLAQTKAGWNVAELLRRTLVTDPGVRMRLPSLEITGGRLNVRSGETKSVYYFGDVDLRVEPPDERGRTEIYFDGIPVRSDRGMRGFGRLSARGSINLEGGQPRVALRLAMERSAVSEILMLTRGQGTGIGGFVSAQASVNGPMNALKLEGRTQLEEFERWSWILGSGRGPALTWKGTLDLDHGTLQLGTATSNIPVSAQVRASEILGKPVWGILVTMREAPAESVKSLADELGVVLPPLEALGKLDGAVSYDAAHGLRGEFDLSDASFRLPDVTDAAVAPKVQLVFEGGKIRILPARFQVGRDAVTVEGNYQFAPGSLSTGAASVKLICDNVDVATLRKFGAPFPAAVRRGRWQGALTWEALPESSPAWRGDGIMSDGEVTVGGAGASALFTHCRLRIRRSQVESAELQGTIDGANVRAALRLPLAEAAADDVEVSLGELTGERLGSWLFPPRDAGDFLDRALRAEPLFPSTDRGFRGTVRIAGLEWPEFAFAPVRFQIQAKGADVEITALHARSGAGSVQGELRTLRDGRRAAVEGTFTLHQMPWREGHVDGKLELAANSSSVVWIGVLTAAGVELVPGERWTRFSSKVEIRKQDRRWRWRFPDVEIHPAEPGAAVLRGHGGTNENGKVQLDVSGPAAQQRYLGDLWDGPWESVR